jgi:hypothetical protein
MAKMVTDTFANIAAIQVDESAPNTLTYKKLETGIAVFEKVAWLISRVEYAINNIGAGQFNATGDLTRIALTVSNMMNSLASGVQQTASEVLHAMTVQRLDFGAAASGGLSVQPFVFDFSALPGGGILVPPTAIYLAVQGESCVAANTAWARIYYTTRQLTTEDYWQLVEARRIISS